MLVSSALLGCQTRDDLTVPVDFPESFSGSGTDALEEKWWTEFRDGELNGRVERALENNFTLEAANQRREAARAVFRRESASLFPFIQGNAGAEFSGGENGGGGGNGFGGENEDRGGFRRQGGGGGGEDQELSLGLSASYEVDLWGRVRAASRAERFRFEATKADYEAAAISISAEVALAWFRVIEARSQEALLREQVETNEKTLESLTDRFESGQTRSVDLLRQRQLIEANRGDIILEQANAEVLSNALALLQGMAPRKESIPAGKTLPVVPELPRTGIPAETVFNRPDVKAAFFRVQAADQEVAEAISDQFPRINLTARLQSDGEVAADLFDDWFRAIAGDLVAPVFEAGRRRAEVDRTQAVLREALAELGQTILMALREVEDALIQEQKQRELIGSLGRQVELAGQSYDRLTNEYFNGVSDFLDVLNALTVEQQLERDLLEARLRLLEFRIGLHRALADSVSRAD